MPIEILMPALSPTMTTGNIAKWRVKVGDTVKSGDVMAEIETDKATMELEAVDEGKVAKIIAAEGAEDVAVNSPIAILTAENESLAADASPAKAAEAPKAAPKEAGSNAAQAQGAEQAQDAEKGAEQEQQTDAAKATDGAVSGAAVSADAGFASVTVRDALRDAMAEEMRKDKAVFLIGEEVAEYQGAYKVSRGMLQEFGADRVVDTPISEIGFTGMSVGSAMAGMKPILEYMTFNFAMQAIDHIVNSAVKTRYMSGGLITCPIVFRGPNGAAARVAAQHSQCFASWYAHCPGLIVIAPYDAADAKGLLKSAIRSPNPVVFLENEVLYGMKGPVDPDPELLVPIGKARVRRTGSDVTVVAYSRMVQIAEAAAETLAGDGIDVEVIDLRTIRPLDIETIVESVKKTNRIVSIEEGWPFAGIGSEIAALVFENAFDWLDAPMVRVCGEDVPMPYAANLENMALPNEEKLVKAIKDVCVGKGSK